MIELQGTEIYKHGAKVGHLMAETVFLTKEISEAEQRIVSKLIQEQCNTHVSGYLRPGDIRIVN